LVTQGEFVQQGQVFGLCGTTGLSNAPHLHYEIKFLANQTDPKPFMAWGVANYDDLFKQVQEIKWQSLIK
jgi:murein DD-endopeptidase MepM/ murein hydrolase activator NlpD